MEMICTPERYGFRAGILSGIGTLGLIVYNYPELKVDSAYAIFATVTDITESAALMGYITYSLVDRLFDRKQKDISSLL